MAKIIPRDKDTTIHVQTGTKAKARTSYKWWKANSKSALCSEALETALFLKEMQQGRFRQMATFARLYGNMPMFSVGGASISKINGGALMPNDRPTMNVIQSIVDTKVSRITQQKPRPMFLTENGDYKQRALAKRLNAFIMGEFYQTKAYQKGRFAFRDGCVFGDGVIKIIETPDHKVGLERRLAVNLAVDPNEAHLQDPRQLFEFMLIDRDVLAEYFPKYRSIIDRAEKAFPDNSAESGRTISDQILVVEAWHLRSGENAGDGKHIICCSEGIIYDEDEANDEGFIKDRFPFVLYKDSPKMSGYWSQGVPERILGTQVQINEILQQISLSQKLMGVPRIWVEEGSKVVKAHINNMIGAINTYKGNKPIFEVSPLMPAETYQQLERLINYCFQTEGINQMSAQGQKPAGLNSGEAIRAYSDQQSDRLSTASKDYEAFYEELAYQVIDKAIDIKKEQGKYKTVSPDKHGIEHVELPDLGELHENPFTIQCFEVSSLPKDPAGRLQRVTEMAQAGMVTMQEARRLIDYPDIEQVDKLANAAEERIYKMLDDIVYDGKYEPPDPFIDIQLAEKTVTQYINLHMSNKLGEQKAGMLRDWFTQIQTLKQEAQQAMMPPPGAMQAQQGPAMAVPQARPTSDVLPIGTSGQ